MVQYERDAADTLEQMHLVWKDEHGHVPLSLLLALKAIAQALLFIGSMIHYCNKD